MMMIDNGGQVCLPVFRVETDHKQHINNRIFLYTYVKYHCLSKLGLLL